MNYRITPPECKLSKLDSESINICKLFLSIMVIFIHAYATFSSDVIEFDTPVWLENTEFIVSEIISRCAVPGFFLISAILLYRKNWSWKTNCFKKLKSLGIPYIIMNALWIGIFFIANHLPFIKGFVSPDNLISSFGELLDAFIGYQSGYPFLYPLWFLRDLLILNILSLVIWKLIDKYCNFMLAASLLCWIFVEKTGLFFLNLQGICFWILGGVFVKKKIKFDFLDKIPLFWQFIIYSILVAFVFILKDTVFYLPIKRIAILSGILFWFALARAIKKEKIRNILLYLSTFNFEIYIFHEFLTSFSIKVCSKIFPLSPISQLCQYFLIPIAITAICIVISIILKKVFPKLYTIATGGRS